MIALSKKILIDKLGLPDTAICDKIIDVTRWSIVHEIVFQYKDKFYRTTYRVGATELQDEMPWEYDDNIDCEEVQLRDITVKTWVSVENE